MPKSIPEEFPEREVRDTLLISSLALLPQGKHEAAHRARATVAKMDELGFGNCTNTRTCEMECPKHVTIDHIARLNREYLKAKFSE